MATGAKVSGQRFSSEGRSSARARDGDVPDDRAFAVLDHVEREAEARRRLDCLASEPSREACSRTDIVPPTPGRIAHLEEQLTWWLRRRCSELARPAPHVDYPDTSRIVEHLVELDLGLAPDSWRMVLRTWAQRQLDELVARRPQSDSEEWVADEGLQRYLSQVDETRSASCFAKTAPYAEEDTRRWIAALTPREVREAAVAVLADGAGHRLRSTPERVRWLDAIAPTPELVADLELTLDRFLEELAETQAEICSRPHRDGRPPTRPDHALTAEELRGDSARARGARLGADNWVWLCRSLREGTWQPALRGWAEARTAALAARDDLTPWQSAVKDWLDAFLLAVPGRSVDERPQP